MEKKCQAHNLKVVGSNPTCGAIFFQQNKSLNIFGDKLLKLAVGILKTLHIDYCFLKSRI